jgi:hypothetical protein
MVTIEKATPDYPNILLVYGNEFPTPSPSGEYRPDLEQLLYDPSINAGSPVKEGTHDFWVTFEMGSRDRPQNHAYENMSITPRKMRGILEMGDVPLVPSDADYLLNVPDRADNVRGLLTTLVHEIGHHWLVPRDLLIGHPNFWPSLSGSWMPTSEEITMSLNEGTRFYGPLLLGRENKHWSSFFQGDGGAEDGVYWQEIDIEHGYNYWEQRPPANITINLGVAGFPPIDLQIKYNDLELLIMGLKDARSAYPPANQFSWLEPRLVAPLDYYAGMCFFFSQEDYFYFGFSTHHKKLVIQHLVQHRLNYDNVFDLSGTYKPLMSELAGIGLRIVRVGDEYYFEAKLDNPRDEDIGIGNPRLLDGDDVLNIRPPRLNPGDNLIGDFRILDSLNVTEIPKAVGVMVKTWSGFTFCNAAFLNFEILANGHSDNLMKDYAYSPIPIWTYSNETPADVYSSISMHSLVFNTGNAEALGARYRTQKLRLHLIAPYMAFDNSRGIFVNVDPPFDYSSSIDRAPRVLTRAPTGDFAFATSAKIDRSCFTPWAAGAAIGRSMWGKVQTANTNNVILSSKSRARQTAPENSTYKIAFILVARQRSEISPVAIRRADILRRYWDEAFMVLTDRRRRSDSTL